MHSCACNLWISDREECACAQNVTHAMYGGWVFVIWFGGGTSVPGRGEGWTGWGGGG